MVDLLNVDLQEQSPSAEETASGNAIITVFEIYLADSDLGGAGTDKLYFHDGTKSPADSYGSIQMYSPIAESSWGSTASSDYSLVTYTPFPFEFSGYERRTKGALPRPTIRFANVNRDFTIYNTNHNDLLGAKIIRRRTLVKYLLENPPVEFPKEIYYVERLVSESQLTVEFELTTNFDVRGIVLPSRRIVASRCPWKYKDSTVGGCDWPTDSTKDITDNNSSTTSQKIYVDVDDTYITAGSHGATTYSVWADATAYTKDYFVEYYIPLAADYTIDAATRVDSTHSRYTTAGTSLGFSVNDYINVRGSVVTAWDHEEIHLKITARSESDGNTLITVLSPDPGNDAYTSGGLISKTRNTLFRCKRGHTSDAPQRPGVATDYWEVGDICGKRLTSCRMRYGYNPNAGGVESVLGKTVLGVQLLGAGYTGSAPTIAIAAPSSGTTATATCTVSGGAINAITVTNAGSGYASPPTVTVSGGSPSTAAVLIAVCRGAAGEPDDVPLPFGGFPGAVTYA